MYPAYCYSDKIDLELLIKADLGPIYQNYDFMQGLALVRSERYAQKQLKT
jgi:hypothetical protein